MVAVTGAVVALACAVVAVSNGVVVVACTVKCAVVAVPYIHVYIIGNFYQGFRNPK